MSLPTGTVTFLFTDIQGSTALWEADPDAMRSALARHDALLSRAIAAHGGQVFKTIGDAFCAAFAVVPEALSAALTIQQDLLAESWATATPIRIRIALHTAEVEEQSGDYFGPEVNRVARLLAVGHGGQTILSASARLGVGETLPESVSLRDLGLHRLKDLNRPEQVYQLCHPNLPDDAPPLRSLDNPKLPNNLPSQPTSFIGREREVSEVKSLLTRTRLLTLTGSGGCGKTRLALQAAAELLEGTGDGVWLAELAPLTDPDLVVQTVARVFGVREAPGELILTTLVQELREKHLLLLLDNCEHVLNACARLADTLLRQCPGVALLVTSREALNIPGEMAYRVPSLALPELQTTQTPETLNRYAAARLFIERARSHQPAFQVSATNASALASLCVHLDGIPLALELAAARVKSLAVEEIAGRLDQRFRLLTGGSRTALPRHQTLRSLIDWSYDLLTPSEKTLLQRLSVFAGGWPLDAAEKICSGERLEDWEVLDALTSLVDKSLVSVEEQERSTRYRLLETVRQYAQERLRESENPERLRDSHARYFEAYAAGATDPSPEYENIRGALETLRIYTEGGERLQCLCLSLTPYWLRGSRYSEALGWCQAALAHPGAQAPTTTTVPAPVINLRPWPGEFPILHRRVRQMRRH